MRALIEVGAHRATEAGTAGSRIVVTFDAIYLMPSIGFAR